MQKKISIIIPCYNAEKYIHHCINSLLTQTIGLENLELIFVNDASTDNTFQILSEYEAKYSDSIILINSEENLRQGGARNLGLNYANSDYIGFIDADDWIDITMYQKLYNMAMQYDCEVVSCRFKRVYDTVKTPVMGRTGEDDRFVDVDNSEKRTHVILGAMGGSIVTKIFKRSLVLDNHIKFPEHLAYEDNYWGPLINLYVKNYYVLEEYLYYYYRHLDSTVSQLDSLHHLDRLTIETMKIDEYKSRGLFDTYHSEIEFEFIRLFYLGTLQILFECFTDIPPNVITYMQQTLLTIFPDYKSNPYLNKLSPMEQLLLETVGLVMKYDEWNAIKNEYLNKKRT